MRNCFSFSLISILSFFVGVIVVWVIYTPKAGTVIEPPQSEPAVIAAVETETPGPVMAQRSEAPNVLRRVAPLKVRDKSLEREIAAQTGVESDNAEVRYYYNRVDLNGDRNPEVLVFLYGDHQCGTGGCSVLLFSKTRKGYKLLTSFDPTRNPVIVSETKTHGWSDLLFFNSGGGINPGYYSVVRHDGQSYPENPTVKRIAPPLEIRVRGIAYLVGEVSEKPGIRLR